MDMNQLMTLQKVKKALGRLQKNHPKFPLFLKAVSKNAIREGTLIEINVTEPDGRTYCSNICLKEDDIEMIESLRSVYHSS